MENLSVGIGEIAYLCIFEKFAECIGSVEAVLEDWHDEIECQGQTSIWVQQASCEEGIFFGDVMN